MNAISITSMSTPDAVDAPRDRRPLRSRTAGPRTGRSVVAVVVAVGLVGLVGVGLVGLVGLGLAGTLAEGASAAASAMGPCARAAGAPASSANAKNSWKCRLRLTGPAYRTALFGDA
jgi:hypothetical protein